MNFVIYTIIILLILIVAYGAWSRRQIYRDVDKLGNRKAELLNRPVGEELDRVKALKLSGETQERFEQWRGEWDQLVRIQLPYIEEKLFEVEELANKYRFPKAQSEIKETKKALDEIENHIDALIEEVNELVDIEGTNRVESRELTAVYEEIRRRLQVDREELDQAADTIENEMEKVDRKFEVFLQETEEGNYFNAQETLAVIREMLTSMNYMTEAVPERLMYVQRDLPSQVEELDNGLDEMAMSGFPVHLYSSEDLIENLKERVKEAETSLFDLQMEKAQEIITSVEETLQEMMEKLEQEAIVRNEVEQEFSTQKSRMYQVPEQLQRLVQEQEVVKLRYQLHSSLELEVNDFFARMKSLKADFAALEDAAALKRMTYTDVHNQLEVWKEEITQLEADIEQMYANFNKLRQDELDAEDIIDEDAERVTKVRRALSRSSLPKIPDITLEQVKEAERKLYYAAKLLDSLPIGMEDVRKAVAEADAQTENAEEAVNKMLEDARMAERVVQYGNRYRTQNDKVNILLLQAEDRFRQGYYEESLELAVAGVEKVEKNVLERIKKDELK
ncbi:MAG: hypothetical protein EA344_08820 [Alkalicoccus sp.]|nr:MAG: hypothetical protein EA344_08820 [Alkalicoccus sp.]